MCCFVVSLDIVLQCVVASADSDLDLVSDKLTVQDLNTNEVLGALNVHYWYLEWFFQDGFHFDLQLIVFIDFELYGFLLFFIDLLVLTVQKLLLLSRHVEPVLSG